MNVLLIEDDVIVADTNEQLLKIIDPSIQIKGRVSSIKTAISWFDTNPTPDLIFADIELEDGNCFEIFRVVSPRCMIVFVTSHNSYAIQAFKLNSIDYILKPVTRDALEGTLKKINEFREIVGISSASLMPNMNELIRSLQQERKKHLQYKSRFLVRRGQKLVSIPTPEIAYFYTTERINYLKTKSDQTYLLDYTLDELQDILPPDIFFRISRSFYLSVTSVENLSSYQGNRLLLELNPPAEKEVVVSRERVADFKSWLGK
jgi:two-component system, LytTR family, response regulator LytT